MRRAEKIHRLEQLGGTRQEKVSWQSKMCEFRAELAPIGGLLALPAGQGPFPGVIVIPTIRALDEFAKDVVERLATENFVALAVNFFDHPGVPEDIFKRPGAQPDDQVSWRSQCRACHAAATSAGGRPTGVCMGLLSGWPFRDVMADISK